MSHDLREAAMALIGHIEASSGKGDLVLPAGAWKAYDSLRAALASPREDERGVEDDRVAKIRAYATESAAVCRTAEETRRSDLSKRENGTIADMLREQVFAWGEKAKSYDALVEFIDATRSRPDANGRGE